MLTFLCRRRAKINGLASVRSASAVHAAEMIMLHNCRANSPSGYPFYYGIDDDDGRIYAREERRRDCAIFPGCIADSLKPIQRPTRFKRYFSCALHSHNVAYIYVCIRIYIYNIYIVFMIRPRFLPRPPRRRSAAVYTRVCSKGRRGRGRVRFRWEI